jgi:hypothetical protein
MEMNRRNFLQKLIIAGSSLGAGCLVLAKTILPRRFIWAKPLSKYPGRVKSLGNIASQSEWSG